mmetsp:Transcript_36836/g.49814  ORF Transcript_36836/g.49814 Transcript_36836/m.49814 type:complete len:345 (-) Transcript_36836:77-1111(-)
MNQLCWDRMMAGRAAAPDPNHTNTWDDQSHPAHHAQYPTNPHHYMQDPQRPFVPPEAQPFNHWNSGPPQHMWQQSDQGQMHHPPHPHHGNEFRPNAFEAPGTFIQDPRQNFSPHGHSNSYGGRQRPHSNRTNTSWNNQRQTPFANHSQGQVTSTNQGGSTAAVLFCEPCDKEFNNAKALAAHLKTHVTCAHPGCEFVGSKKVVSVHNELSHGRFAGTGYRVIQVEVGNKMQDFNVLMGTCPEEVEAWRAERRKRWPTAANLLAKQKEDAQLKKDGYLAPREDNSGRMRKRAAANDNSPLADQPPNKRSSSSSSALAAIADTYGAAEGLLPGEENGGKDKENKTK